MKVRNLSRGSVCFFLLALALIVFGSVWGTQAFASFEQLALNHDNYERLLDTVTVTAFYIMACGSMVAAGVGILLVLFLHQIRRTARLRKEADALREKNEAMEALNRQIQELAHHQRLETIGTLTSSIAHEFNNLLTPIMGYSLMAMEKLPAEEEELFDNLLEIYNASSKAKTIISRLSDLSRKNTDETFRLVSPDESIRKTLEVAEPAKPKNVEVMRNLNCWDQRIRANEIQLSQLLLNLILNSFHAMEETGGTLMADTSFDETCIHIRIADTGCGIPEEIKHRIFEPFFTTKEAGKGTGLGLAIAAQVVEDHNGSIQVESTEGKGTVFLVSLPRSKDSDDTQVQKGM